MTLIQTQPGHLVGGRTERPSKILLRRSCDGPTKHHVNSWKDWEILRLARVDKGASRLIELGVGSDIVAATIGHSAASGDGTRTLLRHYVWTDQVERKRQVLAYWDGIVRGITLGGPPPAANTAALFQDPQVRN